MAVLSHDYKSIQHTLMDELRLMHYPIAVKFIFDEAELKDFQENAPEYYSAVKPMTFCQWELAARMKGQTVLAGKEQLGCSNACFAFGWKPMDEGEIKSHAKYCVDKDQAERFISTKARLSENELLAVVVSPLGDTFFDPDTVHFYCDNMQAYHLAVDYAAAMDVHPLKTNITINSSACGGNVYSFTQKKFNMLPACSGSYNAGKTERGEINVIIPGEHIAPTVNRLLDRKAQHGSGSITRPGDHFPGADICKNCPLIIFKKEK
ncbi:uncharacterized protein (DUF169 family) [Desulfobaculum xiamenense]|uniref:Uncharacterized protein (DUF169 family) n=1 Tax=Desulfobaculum xiamenense TaxID=995050 RepID=A0A846QQQ0_9BACT|nr:DUF169 domain-containing protein [Desulfobaculum xiamenense]NJB68822.1 uncharacterized protein (DUF169 family) [Desulfobaculum xiamenense]